MIDWLRPRWRHRDAEVRAAAVREMGPQDQDRLAAIAQSDPDGGVRRLAIKKLEDTGILEALAANEPDATIRELAAERLGAVRVALASSARPPAECEAVLARLTDERAIAAVVIAGAHESVRLAALARVSGARVLRDVVREATDPALRRAALARIEDASVLRSIAVGEYPAELAVAALERIDDADTVRAIADSRTAAKAVRQRARALLAPAAGEGPAVGHKQARARQLALCTAVEALSVERDPVRAAERVPEVQREWEELATHVPPRTDTAERFAKACAAVLDNAASAARRHAEAEHVRVALEENLAARRALCERVDGLDGADALRDLDAARGAWNRLAPVSDERGAALVKRFAAACESCAARHARWVAHEGQRATFDVLVAEAEALAGASPLPEAKVWKGLEQRWAASDLSPLTSDESALLRHRFASAAERLEQRRQEAEQRRSARQRENLARLETLGTRLAELTAGEGLDLSAARRALQAADTALQDLGPLPRSERPAAWMERLSEARDQLRRRLRQEEETEEWRRWANVGAQEDIIRRVEALLESNDLAEGTRQLARLQEDWAAVASAPPDKAQALWERFRTARNQLRGRCDAYLAENLEKKRALCAQVAELGESTEWNATADLIKRLQAEWKDIGPVPGRHVQSIWLQFREPCDRFFARRKEHFARVDGERRENVQKKTALCEQAEALAGSTDWDATATAIKRLQAEWKRTGGLPRGQSEELWQRFKTACDRFFDRSRRRDELAAEAALQRAEAICGELEAFAASLGGEEAPSAEQAAQQIDAAWAEWVRLGVATSDQARGLNDRLQSAFERIVAARPEGVRATRLGGEATRKRREKLCDKLEALAGAAPEAPREQSLREMALALRERLATNTIAGAARGTSGDDAQREVERISASWAQLGPVLDDEARALAERFERALARAASR
jgi:hypothetical protein